MDAPKVILVLVQLSVFLITAAIGLRARDRTRGQRIPRALMFRSVLTLNVMVPIIAIAVALVFDPIRPVKIALVLLAISPVPPFLPRKLFRLSRDEPYIYSLMVTTSLLSIAFVPTVVALLGAILHMEYWVPISRVLRVVSLTVLLPLALGAAIRWAAPSFAGRISSIVSRLGAGLLLIVLVVLLAATWRAILSLIGNGTILVIGLVVTLAMMVGHLLGGPDPEDRVVLGHAAAAHHPGVALAIASYNFPSEHSVAAAVLLYLLLNSMFSIPYTQWWKKSRRVARVGTPQPLPH
jgi:BASS family bile acid:Na+ symporter